MKINDTGIILDAGADPEEEGEASLPDFARIHENPLWEVDHAIVTHAHHDHLGSLPVLIREFPHVMVHMTEATRMLAEFLLPASARLQRRRLREGSSMHQPLFNEDELEMQTYLYNDHELEEPFNLKGHEEEGEIFGELYYAGHVLGAAGVKLEFDEGGRRRSLFYTSDTSLFPQSIIPGGCYPNEPVDILVLESTLGADPSAELTTREDEEVRFVAAVKEVLARDGTVLIPVFALGRAQEMLALIDRMKLHGDIPNDIPVYTAGSMRAVADLYDKTRLTTPRMDPDFQVFGVPQKRLPRSDKATREALSKPSIHIMASGMMFERTISNRLATQLVEDEKNGVFLVGFAKEDSPARRLLEAAEAGQGTKVVLDSMVGAQPINCAVDRFRFSGHSHRRELIQLVDKLQPETVILVHGEEDARTWMADNIKYYHPDVEIVVPDAGEAVHV